MRSMLIHKRLGGVAEEQFGHYQEPNILFAVKRFLKYVTTIAVGGKLNHISPAAFGELETTQIRKIGYLPHTRSNFPTFFC